MNKSKSWRNKIKSNMFVTYFVLFASILLGVLSFLGISFIILFNAYTLNEQTKLLSENTRSIASSISTTLSVNDLNNRYSFEKEIICDSLVVVSQAIDADIFVCDVSGQVVLCKEKSNIIPQHGEFGTCTVHGSMLLDDNFLQQVYEGGAVTRGYVGNTECYIVGTSIVSDGQIIGSVFAIAETGTTNIASAVIRLFFFCAIITLVIGAIFIWILTKRIVSPLREMSAAAKHFALGDFSYRVAVNGDDEMADLGRAFNDMADALDKLESSRRSFVANVSHELKTPMTSIAGFIDGILDGTIPKSKQDYYLKIVSDEVRRLSRLVVAMLNMSKIESGDFEMKPKTYNLTDQIIHILLNFEQKIEKKNIEIKGLDKVDQIYVNADTDMVYQIVYNLFDNAVKFTNDGGYIDISATQMADCVQVSIKNSGVGINSAELSKIFERFYKVDKSRSLDSNGAGLGLYIVKMMVEMHGGRIYARSENENEAEFIFTLPKA